MATLTNNNKTNIVFVTNGRLVNSVPSPIFDTCVHKWSPLASPYELCGHPVSVKVGQPCSKYCTFSRHTRKCNCTSARKENMAICPWARFLRNSKSTQYYVQISRTEHHRRWRCVESMDMNSVKYDFKCTNFHWTHTHLVIFFNSSHLISLKSDEKMQKMWPQFHLFPWVKCAYK
jgi:hypothetical protein